MKINQKKIKEKLKEVDEKNRSFIYDASIILSFLRETFMPTKYFIGNYVPNTASQIELPHFEKKAREVAISAGDLYGLYVIYRQQKDFTRTIESRYVFGIIVKRLRFYKNQWEFRAHRKGVAQIWYLGPLRLRADVDLDIRSKFPVEEDQTIAGTTVEANPISSPEDEEDEAESSVNQDIKKVTEKILEQVDQKLVQDLVSNDFKPQFPIKFRKEHKKFPESGTNNWQTAEYELPETIEVNAERFKEAKFDLKIEVESLDNGEIESEGY